MVFLICLAIGSLRQTTSRADEGAIRAFYARLDKATSSGNLDGMIALMSPDYVMVTADGRREPRAEVIKGLRHFFQVNKDVSALHKLRSIKIKATQAVVEVSGIVESRFDMQSKHSKLRTEFDATNKLEMIHGTWMLRFDVEHKHNYFVDGKLVSK